jgi:hypothetical protein
MLRILMFSRVFDIYDIFILVGIFFSIGYKIMPILEIDIREFMLKLLAI